ncbi:MAG: hypothetical protein OSB19_02205 [Opitutaceae bacterium]|nr:hypothetical protein [Opitutaceae bacterium]
MNFLLSAKTVSLFTIACLAFMPTALAQQKAMPPEETEAARQRFNQSIENAVLKVMKGIEMLEEQVEPVQKVLIGYFAPFQIERMKMQAERQKMAGEGRERQGRGGGGNRDAMMARMAKLEKLRTDADKKIKAILDKKQFKKYKAVMEEVVPPQRRPGGRGGRGGPGGGR